MTLRDKLVHYFTRLPAARRRTWMVGGVVAAVLGAASAFVALTDTGENKRAQQRKPDFTYFSKNNPREVSVEALAGIIKNLRGELAEQKRQTMDATTSLVKTTEAVQKAAEQMNQRISLLQDKNDGLTREVQAMRESPPIGLKGLPPLPPAKAPPKIPAAHLSAPPDEGSAEGGEQTPKAPEPPAPPPLKIRVIKEGGADKPRETDTAKPRETLSPRIKVSINAPDRDGGGQKFDPVLPAGSILSGTLINGLDAPTGVKASTNPFPSVLRVKHEAILPNRFRMDITECFLISGGYGDLSSERAYLRAETLSCVKKDGSVIDATTDAFAVGEDGKAGVRGRLVSKNGQLIANTLLSGFVAGVGRAFTPVRSQPITLDPNSGSSQEYQWPAPQMVAAQAGIGAVRGASEQIAEYYLEMAKSIFPVVEIDAGRRVDFILLRAVSLKPGVNQNRNNQPGNGMNRTMAGLGNVLQGLGVPHHQNAQGQGYRTNNQAPPYQILNDVMGSPLLQNAR